MVEHMIPCQTGFVKGSGTHVNIVRLIKRFLTKYNDFGREKGKFKPKLILFIDFKSAQNNVNLDLLIKILLDKKILDPQEVASIKTLYSKNTATVGNKTVEIHKGVMQGSTSAQHYLIYSLSHSCTN